MSINKVAKLAGVSNSTVSRVINNHPRVAPETAKAVRKAMSTLDYKPSDRRPGPKPSLRTRTGATTIAFLVFGTSRNRTTPAFERLLNGVSLASSANNLNLLFAQVPNPEELPGRIIDANVNGLLLHGALPGPEVRERLQRIPTVWLMGNRRRPEWGDQVMPDGYEIGELAARYLTERGHKHLAFFDLDADHWAFRVYGHAFSASAADHGAQVHQLEQKRQLGQDYWQPYMTDSTQELVDRYCRIEPRPTGIFVADDMQAATIQPALQRSGVDIRPGGVEVVSCNNEISFLMGLSPRPASIDIRAEAIGQRGVEQLIWRLEHPDIAERTTIAVEPLIAGPASEYSTNPTTASVATV
ncbi:MAG TPA: LacI family DNA-binding transcriptional regulator [Tepidisphaeraceae bacterium]|jgi:LacI family transcriptional regulator